MWKRLYLGFSSRTRIASLVVTMALLYGADRFLAAVEQRELGAEARHYADAGRDDLQHHRPEDAISQFQHAHDTERDNREYALELADALIIDRQPDRAMELIDELLDEDSNDGAANLLMARANLQENQYGRADSYFHRAIYGSWGANEKRKVEQARLELVQSLASRNQNQALLAELIPLEQSTDADSAVERQIPALYLQAGSIGHAEDAYRALIRREPGNADAHAGLGRVEMQKGSYHAAHQEFVMAAKDKPDDAAFGQEAEAAQKALELDPTPRRLPSAEKLGRSTEILKLVTGVVQACGPEALTELNATATEMLTGKQPKAADNETAEARLDIAEQIWKKRPAACKPSPQTAELLDALMRKISQ